MDLVFVHKGETTNTNTYCSNCSRLEEQNSSVSYYGDQSTIDFEITVHIQYGYLKRLSRKWNAATPENSKTYIT